MPVNMSESLTCGTISDGMPLRACEAPEDEPIMREAGNVTGQQFQSSETVFTEAESIDGPGEPDSIYLEGSLAGPGLDVDPELDEDLESEVCCHNVPNQEFNLWECCKLPSEDKVWEALQEICAWLHP